MLIAVWSCIVSKFRTLKKKKETLVEHGMKKMFILVKAALEIHE